MSRHTMVYWVARAVLATPVAVVLFCALLLLFLFSRVFPLQDDYSLREGWMAWREMSGELYNGPTEP